ncbi:MAG TPA: glycosyl transferase [Actinobacteria bacterium]|nr:glycosyl transferase [Actinomycetota bacterium]
MQYRNLILIFFILAKFVIQYFSIDSGYELHRDEYLHLDLGNHLAFGYISVPPMTGFFSLIIKLLGNSIFWVKFFPALFGAMIIWIVWKTIEELNGGLFALILGSTGVLFSILLRINTLYQPNSLDFMMWTLFLYVFVKYLKTEENKWLYICSIIFATGFLNKYNIGFLMMALFLSLVVTRKRTIFINKHLFYSAAIALIIILPNIIWQFKNDWPVIHHLKELSETQLVNVKRSDFLAEQLFFFPGSILVIISALISFFIYDAFKNYRVLFFTFLFTLTIFTCLKAKNYYSIGLYPVYLAFGAVYIEKIMSSGWIKYLRILFLSAPLITFIFMFPLLLPVLSPQEILERKEIFDMYDVTRWEDGKIHQIPQDYADMLGWKELAQIVDSAMLLIDEKEKTLIHCDNYGQTGAINFYSKELVTRSLSMNADYINWYPLETMDIKNVILVKEASDTDKNREKEIPLFDKVFFIGRIESKFAREIGTSVYLLEGAKISINEILKNEIKERKNKR